MAAGAGSVNSLEHTPTWAVAAVCFIIISLSIVIEQSIHHITKWLKRRRKTGLFDAVDRLKSELMLLGFVSLMLAVTQESIAKICIAKRFANVMLPCRNSSRGLDKFLPVHRGLSEEEDEDRDGDGEESAGKYGGGSEDFCDKKGMVSLVSQEGLQQLQIFIFVLALMQIVYSVLTMALGRAKMKRWKAWEEETQTTEYQVSNDPNRFRFTRETTFGRRHMTQFTGTAAQLWIKCFFRQFFNSVAKVDYLTLRHGFIAAHFSERYNDFNFQKYIQRSLEKDFKEVVSISPLMWLIVVILMLVDVYGWHIYLWVSTIPLFIGLALGTKLEMIVARMALRIKNQHSVIAGTPLVQPHDDLFWFGKPRFVLLLLHLILFVNAFEISFFIWVSVEFGLGSCYHEHKEKTIIRVVLAVLVQILCSYITLPLYALVTQMGSQFKTNMLQDQAGSVIKQWHAEVRQRRNVQLVNGDELTLVSARNSLSTDGGTHTSSSVDVSSHEVQRSVSVTEDVSISVEEEEITEVVEDESDAPGGGGSSSWVAYQKNMMGSSTRELDRTFTAQDISTSPPH